MFNIGIIGCGKIAQVRHIPEYADHPQAKLAGFFALNQDRARALAEQWGGKASPPGRSCWPTPPSTR